MTDETGAPLGGEAVSDLPADAPESFSSITEAANYFSSLTEKRAKEPAAESAEVATAEPELSGEDNAGPEEVPGETEEVEAVDPPIERPKSWSKDEDAEWQSIPRAMQQKIVAREMERDNGTVRSQQKAADAAKAAEAKAAQAEEARQQYEGKIKLALQALTREQQRDFPDIKTWDDVKNLQQTDPFRYQEWDVHQKELALVNAEAQSAEARQSQAKQNEARERKNREHALLIEKAPEFADAKKLSEAQTDAATLFREKGFTDQELEGLGDNPFIDDHRFQLIVADALKYRAIQKAPKAIAAKPLPPVLRPGNSRPAGADASEREQALTRKPELDIKEATELYALQSRRQRRA